MKVKAGANIALIKYWGKRETADGYALNLPSTSSLSVTLSDLYTLTEVVCEDALNADEVIVNGVSSDDPRIPAFLNHIRAKAGQADLPYCRVVSDNNFPTAAGLASSASGFAALSLAASHAYGLSLDLMSLSQLARLGSGSAPRSLIGGFACMHRGVLHDGSDAIAEPVMDESQWPLEVVIAITSQQAKTHSSRLGMHHTMATSPYYKQWIMSNESRLAIARHAVLEKDFSALADVSEASALQMHASAIAAQPGVLYWSGATVECIHAIRALRANGLGVFFTIDAGPQVKAVCLPGAGPQVTEALASVSGVLEVRQTALGPGAHVL